MCIICGQYSCPGGCPNFDSRPYYYCSACGQDIALGEDYFAVAGEVYCEECIYSGRRTAGE